MKSSQTTTASLFALAGVSLSCILVSGCAAEPDPSAGMPATSTPAPTGTVLPLAPVMAMGEVTSMVTEADGTVVTTTSDGTVTRTAPDGTVTTTAADGTTTVRAPDGTSTTTAPDGTVTFTALDGTVTVTAVDGTVTTIAPDGTTVVTPPGGVAPVGTGSTPVGTTPSTGPGPAAPVDAGAVWINARGRVEAANNTFGIAGDWYAFGDGTTGTQSGNPFSDGKYCVQGEATGDAANWGVGIGLDLNNTGSKMAYEYTGKLTGFRIKVTGEAPSPPRLHFVSDMSFDVTPFIDVQLGESVVYPVADAQVPFSWGVDNAGQRVENGLLYAVQLLAPGDSATGPIHLCIEEFEPVFEPDAGQAGVEGNTYINSEGFIQAADNSYGVTGPVYVISDGNSTAASGVPYREGKYCVAGEFSGAADDWGAGIALDLNNPPGGTKSPFAHAGKVAAFRFGLSGTTPGNARIQFVINEPQTGDQPFLVAQMNTTESYPIAWATVPESWEVADSGLEVGDSVVTVQLFLEGDQPGPFDVCIEDFAPLSAAELVYEAPAQPNGWNGFRTVDPARIAGEYQLWKSRHFQDCGDGSACVPRDEGDCISEGVAYGMLLTVGNDDQTGFDQLWAYFDKHKTPNGVMKWQTDACGAAITEGSASDGDLDAAYALLQAGCKWGGDYKANALTLLGSIAASEVTTCAGGPVLKPGDNFGGCSETDPSYIMPAWYRVFAEVTGDAVWTQLIDTGYQLLEANQARKGGLFSDWSNDTGGVSAGDHSDDFGPDASRVPWRLATDYLWYSEARAVPLLDTFAATVDAQGGPARAFTSNSNFRGGSAFSVIHRDAPTAAEYTSAWLLTAVDDQSYFPGTLRPLYMMLAAGTFAQACSE